MLDRSSTQNRFRACLYNKFEKDNHSREEVKLIKEYVPESLENNTFPVDMHKWMKAINDNPDHEKLIPTQIGSVAELK